MSEADELLKYKDLLDSGLITRNEFDTAKSRILGSPSLNTDNILDSEIDNSSDFTTDNVTEEQESYQNYNGYMYYNNFRKQKSISTNINDLSSEFKQRKGMKIASIVCLVFSLMYLLIAITSEILMINMVVFFGILGFMFYKFSKVPKEYIHIGNYNMGLKKSHFVIVCLLVSVISTVFITVLFENDETETIISVETEKPAENEQIKDNKTENRNEQTEVEKPIIEFANELEEEIYNVVTNNGGIVGNIYLEQASENNNQLNVEYVEFICENNEEKIQAILNHLVNLQKADGTITISALIKESNDDTGYLIIADINQQGDLKMIFESPAYNSARNLWFQNLFSIWDGSCIALTDLIKKNLNDEKSYEHIETTYIDIKSEDTMNEINKTFSSAGYNATVEIGDVLLVTKFSAKNAFGGIIKNTAYGVASYNYNTITLVAIE